MKNRSKRLRKNFHLQMHYFFACSLTMSKVPFKFEEFYEAFGKSVSSDVIFEDGQVHIIQREKPQCLDDINSQKKAAPPPELSSPVVSSDGPLKKHAKGRLLDSADRRRLPWAIRALLEIQEPDGSWVFSSAFEFVINGVAPCPMEGVASKLWATAIALTVWRQFPEYFELLETYYEKAMLHADENVLRIVRSVLQFDALDQIRAYKNDEARAIRERLEREAAAKRELEMEEEEKIARLREDEVRIGKLSLIHARRLPMPMQKLFVAELGNEFAEVFSTLPPAIASLTGSSDTFTVGQLVESCRRRRTCGSALTIATTPTRWHRCRITAIDEECRLLQLDFLDGDCERERRVPVKFVRSTAEGAQEIRAWQFTALQSSWGQPLLYEKEVARFEEARAIKLKPLPWDYRHHLTLQGLKRDGSGEAGQDRGTQLEDTLRPSSAATQRRPRSRHRDNATNANAEQDTLFQAAAAILVQYDRACTRVREAVHSGAKRYTASILFRERFHAFDELADALVTLMEHSVEALEAVWRWKRCAEQADGEVKTFIWKGDDFVLVFVRSLDFLAGCCELVEWYGEEFPLDANPFMLSTSLLEKAEDRGLAQSIPRPHPLRMHKRDDETSSPPSWWPQCRYSSELRRRIEQAEQTLFKDLQASRFLVES